MTRSDIPTFTREDLLSEFDRFDRSKINTIQKKFPREKKPTVTLGNTGEISMACELPNPPGSEIESYWPSAMNRDLIQHDHDLIQHDPGFLRGRFFLMQDLAGFGRGQSYSCMKLVWQHGKSSLFTLQDYKQLS